MNLKTLEAEGGGFRHLLYRMRKLSLNKWLVIASVVVILIPIIVTLLKIFVTREAPFLRPEGGARWIKMTEPVNLKTWTDKSVVAYSKQFVVEKAIPDSVLKIRALGTAHVYLDGRSVTPFDERDDWKNPRSVELRDLLPGPHELVIAVSNDKGPAPVLAYSNTLGIFTGPGWAASEDGKRWLPVTPVKKKKPADVSLRYPSTAEALHAMIPVYLPLFAVCFFLVFFPSLLTKSIHGWEALQGVLHWSAGCFWPPGPCWQ